MQNSVFQVTGVFHLNKKKQREVFKHPLQKPIDNKDQTQTMWKKQGSSIQERRIRAGLTMRHKKKQNKRNTWENNDRKKTNWRQHKGRRDNQSEPGSVAPYLHSKTAGIRLLPPVTSSGSKGR